MSVEGDEEEIVLRLRGDVDVCSAPAVLAAVEAAATLDRCGRLVVDLSEVSLLDSAGIGVLVRAAMLQESGGESIIVRNPNRSIRRLLDLMKLTDLLPIETGGRG